MAVAYPPLSGTDEVEIFTKGFGLVDPEDEAPLTAFV